MSKKGNTTCLIKRLIIFTLKIKGMNKYSKHMCGGSVVYWLEFSPPTSVAAGSNLGPGASCWKVGSYLLMPGGLQCSVH